MSRDVCVLCGLPTEGGLPTCPACLAQSIADDWDRQKRYMRCRETFAEAANLAARNGMLLLRHTDYHYSLRHTGRKWILNLYPSKGRIWGDRRRCGPFLHLAGRAWTFLDVVNEAIRAEKDSHADLPQRDPGQRGVVPPAGPNPDQ